MSARRPCPSLRPRLSGRSTSVRRAAVPEAAVLVAAVPEVVVPEVVAPEVAVLVAAAPVVAAPEVVAPEVAVLVPVVAAPEVAVLEPVVVMAPLEALALAAPGRVAQAQVLEARVQADRAVRLRAAQPTLAPECPIWVVPLVPASRRDQARPALAQPPPTGRRRLRAAGIRGGIMEAERSRRGLAPTRCARSTSTAIVTRARQIA
jgi:hypothetical protein